MVEVTPLESALPQMIVYEDVRGDSSPGWGVFRRHCWLCGRYFVAVAPSDRHAGFLCGQHHPDLKLKRPTVEDGVAVYRIGQRG